MDMTPQYKTPDGSAIRIWADAAKNNFLSEKLGRPVYDDVIYLEVIAPGSGGSCPVFEVERTFAKEMQHPEPLRSPQYEQYQGQIDAWKQRIENDASMAGTPLKEWPEISRSMAASLTEARIFTVDALAALPDSRLVVVGPDGRTWREKAQAFLASAQDSSYATSVAAELAEARDQIAAQNEQVKALSEQIEQLMKERTGVAAVLEAATTEEPPVLDIASNEVQAAAAKASKGKADSLQSII